MFTMIVRSIELFFRESSNAFFNKTIFPINNPFILSDISEFFNFKKFFLCALIEALLINIFNFSDCLENFLNAFFIVSTRAKFILT